MKTGLGGNYNTYIGDHSGFNSNCDDSVFIGFKSGYHSDGDGNVFVGREAGFNTDTSLFNTLIGYRSGYYIDGNDSNVSPGYTGNAFMGYKSGYNLKGTSSRNIVIGPDAGPVEILTTDENYDASTSNIEHFKVYIDTSFNGPSNTPLLLGDQSDNTLQTIKLNADVTISKGNSGGTLGVEGSKITLDGPYLHAASSGYTQYGKKWKLQIEDGRTTFANSAHRDSNISFTNHTGDIFQDEAETFINYIIGEDVGSGNGDTSGKLNILFGNSVALNSNSIGSYNTIMGHYSAKSLDGGLEIQDMVTHHYIN